MGRKWNNIKEKKASKDANTSRIYAKFGREIYVAAKQGEPDPESNQALKVVLERAKTYSVPKNIIERAIEKAKGGAEENYDELRYEGFGPNGSMIIVDKNGSSSGGKNVRPCKLMTASSLPFAFTYVIPFPGVPSGKFAGRTKFGTSSIKSNISFLSHVWFPIVIASAPDWIKL